MSSDESIFVARRIVPASRRGVLGVKCFLVPSGIDDFAPVRDDLAAGLPIIARRGGVLLVHAEDAEAPGLRSHRTLA